MNRQYPHPSQLGRIAKGGDTYLRTLLIHGAWAVVNACRTKTDRKSKLIQSLITRRNKNIATVALANCSYLPGLRVANPGYN